MSYFIMLQWRNDSIFLEQRENKKPKCSMCEENTENTIYCAQFFVFLYNTYRTKEVYIVM